MIELIAVSSSSVLAILLVAWRVSVKSRAQRRRLAALVARLEGADSLDEVENLQTSERALSRLELAVADIESSLSEAQTERRRMTEAVDRLDRGLVLADVGGRIVYANPPAARFLGGRHIDAIVDRSIREALEVVLATESGRVQEIELLGPPRRYLALSVEPLDDGERTVGAVAFLIDETNERRVDEVRRDFVANISHELKTPVASLGLLAETLGDTLDEPAVANRLASRLTHEAHRLVVIIDDLLELSRIEAQQAPSREPILVDTIIGGVLERVRSDFGDGEARVWADVEDGAVVIGDRRQLQSAVYNLVQNAVKYSDPDEPVYISGHVDDGIVTIAVRDSGIGIPAREHDRVFERFYRVDRARSRETGGTGLGLAIVRHVVANHGGMVAIESEEGVGSTFTISLPNDGTTLVSMRERREANEETVIDITKSNAAEVIDGKAATEAAR